MDRARFAFFLFPFSFCLLAFSLLSCVRPPETRPVPPIEFQLAVLAWNLHGDRGDVSRLVGHLRDGRLTDGHKPLDVVLLLQEAGPRTIAFAKQAGFGFVFAAARTRNRVEGGSAILSTLAMTSSRAIDLPRERQRRTAAMATVRMGDRDLLLVSVHLENRASWWRGGLPGDRARARQARALVEMLSRDMPGVLGGDLNTWFGTREDAWKILAGRFPHAIPARPIVTFRDRLSLDHLMFDLPDGWESAAVRVEDRYGSDHHPVLGLIATR